MNIIEELEQLLNQLYDEFKTYKHEDKKLNILHEMYGATLFSTYITNEAENTYIQKLWEELYDKCVKEIEG